MTEREFAIDVVRTLREAGYQALWAGGCVRDEQLGLAPKDYDVATDARPEEVRRLFRRTAAVGASFGVIDVLGPKTPEGYLTVEVATFRSDGTYTDGRHPDTVTFSSALNLLIVGVLLILFVIIAPNGIMGLISARQRRRAAIVEAAVQQRQAA